MTPNRAPLSLDGCCCCEIKNEIRPTPVWKIVAAFVLAAALVVVAISIARAAERNGAFEITLLLPPDADRRNIFTLSGAYADRGACERAKKRLIVMAAGARVVCYPAETRRAR